MLQQDIEATIWLEHFLNSIDRTVVLTSHDQTLLDNVAQETIILRNQSLLYFEGTPSAFAVNERKEKRKREKSQDALDKKKAHVSPYYYQSNSVVTVACFYRSKTQYRKPRSQQSRLVTIIG